MNRSADFHFAVAPSDTSVYPSRTIVTEPPMGGVPDYHDARNHDPAVIAVVVLGSTLVLSLLGVAVAIAVRRRTAERL